MNEHIDCFTAKEKEELKADIAMMKRALLGEESTGHTGLVKEMKDMKKWRQWVTLRITALVSAAMAGVHFGPDLFKHIFHL